MSLNGASTNGLTRISRSHAPEIKQQKLWEVQRAIIRGGHLVDLGITETKVLMVYIDHADYDTCQSWPSNEAISDCVGTDNLNRIRGARKALVDRGLLDRVSDGGHGRESTSVYRICCKALRGPQTVPLKNEAKGAANCPPKEVLRGPNSVLLGGRKLSPEPLLTHSILPLSASADANATKNEGQESKVNPPRRSRKQASGAHHDLIRHFDKAWKAKYHADYKFVGGKDGKHVQWILGAVGNDLARATKIVDAYFADTDKFVTDKAHPWGLLVSSFNKYQVSAEARQPKPALVTYTPKKGFKG